MNRDTRDKFASGTDQSDIVSRAEQWITHLAWIGKHDDPCKVASEAAALIRALLDERQALDIVPREARS
jgi:hypothetical protein